MVEAKKGKLTDMPRQNPILVLARGDILWCRKCKSKQVGFFTGFNTLLLCSVIGLIVGVCSIQWEKPLRNLAYQWPSWDELKKEKADFYE